VLDASRLVVSSKLLETMTQVRDHGQQGLDFHFGDIDVFKAA